MCVEVVVVAGVALHTYGDVYTYIHMCARMDALIHICIYTYTGVNRAYPCTVLNAAEQNQTEPNVSEPGNLDRDFERGFECT